MCTFVCSPLLLGLSLSCHSSHGFADGFLVSKELPFPHWLQVLVQLVQNRDACWQVQLHDVFIGHSYRGQQMLVKMNNSSSLKVDFCLSWGEIE